MARSKTSMIHTVKAGLLFDRAITSVRDILNILLRDVHGLTPDNLIDWEQKTETEHASGFHSRETL